MACDANGSTRSDHSISGTTDSAPSTESAGSSAATLSDIEQSSAPLNDTRSDTGSVVASSNVGNTQAADAGSTQVDDTHEDVTSCTVTCASTDTPEPVVDAGVRTHPLAS